MAPTNDTTVKWQGVLAAAARLQELLPDAVLVGGSAAVIHAGHRLSLDDDHILTDLVDRFGMVLSALEDSQGWVSAPVLILGSLDGVETGVRQLIRRQPLEVEEREVHGQRLRIPTLAETLRIKSWLVLRRNATRDYIDVAALADRMGGGAAEVIATMDDYYADQRGPGGQRVSTQVAKQLAEPVPYDLSGLDLRTYRGLDARWHEWGDVATSCQRLAIRIMGHSLDEAAALE